MEDSNITAPIELLAGTQTTAIYFGTPPFMDDMYIMTDDTTSAGPNAKLRIVDAAQNDLPGVDVYVQAPASVPSGNPFATGLHATLTDVTTYQQIPPGSYEVYFTQTGTKSVVYHTAAFTLAGGQNRTVVLFNNYPVDSLQYTSMTLADLN